MVTEAQVWDALAEIPDPEIPVISLVELGVVRDVAVEDGRVRVEFTPTFLGCPALEVMRDQMAAKVRELGGEPEVAVISDDSWSTDRITPEGREKLRAAGYACAARTGRAAARPAPDRRIPLPLLRLDGHEAREPLRPDAVPLAALLQRLGSRSSSSRRSRGRSLTALSRSGSGWPWKTVEVRRRVASAPEEAHRFFRREPGRRPRRADGRSDHRQRCTA